MENSSEPTVSTGGNTTPSRSDDCSDLNEVVRVSKEPLSIRISLVVLVRNELPYLAQWIDWHVSQGFDHFMVIDNESQDGIGEYLQPLIRSGMVDLLLQESCPNLQQIAYGKALRHPSIGEVAVFIDADEFICSDSGTPRQVLESLFSDPSVSAVRLNWRVRHEAVDSVMQSVGELQSRFRHGYWHPCVKTASRVSHVIRQDIHAAHVVGRQVDSRGEQATYVDHDRSEVEHVTPYTEPMEGPAIWVDHYMHLTASEFLRRKALRGSAGRGSRSFVKAPPAIGHGSGNLKGGANPARGISRTMGLRSPASHLYDSRNRSVAEVPMPVAMPDEEYVALTGHLNSCRGNYLEFGSGGSTLLAARLIAGEVMSVESSPGWRMRVLAQGVLRGLTEFRIHWGNVGPVGDWGYPQTRGVSGVPYFDAPWLQGELKFLAGLDTCLVDGRFRVACAIATVLRCSSLRTLLVDDYADREHYHVLSDLLGKPRLRGRLAEFNIGDADINVARLEGALVEYELESR